MSSSIRALSSLAVAVTAAVAAAQVPEKVLTWSAFVSRDVVPAGGAAEIAIQVDLAGVWHVNGHKPADPLLIPTTVSFEPATGLLLGEARFPEPESRKFAFAEAPLLVYEKRFVVKVPVTVDASAAAGEVEIRGTLRYQACDNERCLAPRKEPVAVKLVVGAPGAPSKPQHPEVFGGEGEGKGEGKGGAGAVDAGRLAGLAGRATRSFAEGSYGAAFALIFLIGLGLSFTPCVYPVIPITLGFFANQSEKRGGRTFSLAVVYVLGMACMYSVLGVVAALSGKAFGSALASPWVLAFEAAVMVALALSMFGLWEIGVPTVLATRLAGSPAGHAGALFMGLTVGIVAAPCIGPAILALFTFVAALQSVPAGLAIFFVFALGLGFPFLILGSASGAMGALPRSGEWMLWIKHLFGFLLLGMALYFLRPLAGDQVFAWGIALVALAGGVFLGFLDPVGNRLLAFRRFKAAAGVLLIVLAFAAALGLRPGEATAGTRIAWTAYDPAVFASALGNGRPVLIDFTAEWCLPCKELEHYTFADAAVAAEASRFTAFRADGTVDGDPRMHELQQRFGVLGYPTVLFIDSKGAERTELRVVGFVKPEDFRSRLERVD